MTDARCVVGPTRPPLRRRHPLRRLDGRRPVGAGVDPGVAVLRRARGAGRHRRGQGRSTSRPRPRALGTRVVPDRRGPCRSASSFWVHVTHGDPVDVWIRLEDGTVRAGLRQLENDRPPYDLDGRWIGEATFELPAGLPLGYHRLHVRAGSQDADTALIVSPAAAAASGAARCRPDLGPGDPALQRALRAVLGHRRPDRPDRSGGVVGRRARRGLHPGQPAARRRAEGADGTVAVPADLAPLRQSAVPAGRGDPRVRLHPQPRPVAQGAEPSPRRTQGVRTHRPRRRVEGQAGGAEERLPGAALGWPRAGVRRLPASGRGRASTTSPPGARWPRSTATTGTSGPTSCTTRRVRPSRRSPPSTPTPSTSTGGCSGSSTTS